MTVLTMPEAHPESFARILVLAERVLGDEVAARAWLHSPLPELENESPLAVMMAGEAGAVEVLLENARSGVPG
jgi:uncharacterized protein (DUF2384 family)